MNVMLNLLMKYSIDNRLLIITTNNASLNEKLRKHFNMLFFKNLNIKQNHSKTIIVYIAHVMQFVLNAIFKVLKISANKKNDKDTLLKTNTFNLSNAVFYFNTIVKINIYHINLLH